jgi:hypothetical protein
MLGKKDAAGNFAMKANGITFEHYYMPAVTREGDIHVVGRMKVAGFMDPDDNILNIVSGQWSSKNVYTTLFS